MRSEAETPMEQRYLWFEGKVSPTSQKKVMNGLAPIHSSDIEILFVGYAYADLPFTKRFDIAFPKGRPQDGIHSECHIIAATQQFAKPFFQIPHGWKTICAVQFACGIPEIVTNLPVISAWSLRPLVCICDEIVWEHLRKAADGQS